VPFVRKLSHDGTRFYWLVAGIGFVVLGIIASVVTMSGNNSRSPSRRLETANGAYKRSKKTRHRQP